MMEGSGAVQIMMDPDPGGTKTNGSGSTTLIKMFINLRDTFLQVPFNHPLFIMYSSGTTGAPKCMVHSVGGTLLKHLEEHVVQGNRDHTDVLLYYTTTGRH
jgi:acyl-coenzyme A synthetase/AMP-(fatty) acid ligase